MNKKRLEIFLEFLVFGVFMGVVEDYIAVTLVTGQVITWKGVLVIVVVAIPFAAVGELVVDRMPLLSIKKKKRK
jgi:hypothetical protein